MTQKLNRITELLKELESCLCLISSLEEEMQRQDVRIPNEEGLDGLIKILEAALAKAQR
jgi:hypothetical protein